MELPHWWEWELEFSAHLLERMASRDFTEIDLRTMLQAPVGIEEDIEPGRWRIEGHFRGAAWKVIVEPDHDDRKIVVITAFEG